MLKRIRKIAVLVLLIFCAVLLFVVQNVFSAGELNNSPDQYMELKVVSVEDVEGKDKQVILEWWSYNLKFNALQLRFSYDDTKLKPSNLHDNSYVTDASTTPNFEFTNSFASSMSYVPKWVENGEYMCLIGLDKYDESYDYVELDNEIGEYEVNTNGGVLLGKMSFRLFNGKVDKNTFSLKTGSTFPQSGIAIAQTIESAYQDPSVFKFTVASSDANLASINYEFFNYEEEGVLPNTVTHKESVNLTNTEDGSTENLSIYKLTLNDYLDNISLKLALSDENATVKIDGNAIDITTSKELVLNSLGDEDTVIDIVVTAQDEVTTHTYRLVVHRPYATIKGKIITTETETTTGKYTCGIYVYKQEDVEKVLDWDERIANFSKSNGTDTINQDLHNIQEISKVITNDDGTYEIKVLPGTYNVLQDKSGYLDHIYIYLNVKENDEINLGEYELVPGDCNKDGVVQLKDKVSVTTRNGKKEIDADYGEEYDFNNDGIIQLKDKVTVSSRNGRKREIIDFRKGE